VTEHQAKRIPDSRDLQLVAAAQGVTAVDFPSRPPSELVAEAAGHRKPVANGVDIAAFKHALFDSYIPLDQHFMIF
jgi:hypothetical protein